MLPGDASADRARGIFPDRKVNQLIAAGQLKNRANEPVKEKIDGGLVRQDRKFLYPIRGDIPIMLIDEAIPL